MFQCICKIISVETLQGKGCNWTKKKKRSWSYSLKRLRKYVSERKNPYKTRFEWCSVYEKAFFTFSSSTTTTSSSPSLSTPSSCSSVYICIITVFRPVTSIRILVNKEQTRASWTLILVSVCVQLFLDIYCCCCCYCCCRCCCHCCEVKWREKEREKKWSYQFGEDKAINSKKN